MNKIFSILQKVGQSLMVPVSVLPAAGLLVALGRMIQNASEVVEKVVTNGVTTDHVVITNALVHGVGKIFFSGGLAIFEQLPVVFAIGVAIGFTGGAGVAGLASVVGYFTLTNVLKVVGEVRGLPLAINTGVFGGIIMGLVSANLYQRYYQTKLHPVLGFFSGKRLVPIVTAGAAIGLGIVLGYGWPPIQEVINQFGHFAMNSTFGPALYAAGKRFLIPVGLHHVYYPAFLFEFGSFTTAAGQVLHGESARYFAGDPTAGRFMASEFPIMLFGLPAACLAMYLRAPIGKRKVIAGVMASAALTSIITGITEPIEFAFIFVAPILFVFHVASAFLSGFLTGLFDIHLGYTFSASAIDYVLGFFNQKNSMLLFTVVGPAIGALYFGVFYWAIGFFDLKTPGRDLAESTGEAVGPTSDKAREVLSALGGAGNIKNLDACITRLRLSLNDSAKINQNRLKELGAAGILNAGGGNFQVIFGTESDLLKEEIQTLMAGGAVAARSSAPSASSAVHAGKSTVRAPMVGKIVSLANVPDETFSGKVLGDGIAIDPTEGVVYAPFDGEVAQIFRTNHAVGLVNKDGLEVLVHVGLDTVKMNGVGFKAMVKNGDRVKAGDKLIEFDLAAVRKNAKSTISPIVITNFDQVKTLKLTTKTQVAKNDELFSVEM